MKLISETTKSQERAVNDRATRTLKSLTRPWRDAAGPDVGAMHMTKSKVLQLPSGDQMLFVIGPGTMYEPYSIREREPSEPILIPFTLDEDLVEVPS